MASSNSVLQNFLTALQYVVQGGDDAPAILPDFSGVGKDFAGEEFHKVMYKQTVSGCLCYVEIPNLFVWWDGQDKFTLLENGKVTKYNVEMVIKTF
jgi:hypothetical protein